MLLPTYDSKLSSDSFFSLRKRLAVAAIGIVVGTSTTLSLAVMANHDATRSQRIVAVLGLVFIVGFLGCGHNNWGLLLPGLVLQMVALVGVVPVATLFLLWSRFVGAPVKVGSEGNQRRNSSLQTNNLLP